MSFREAIEEIEHSKAQLITNIGQLNNLAGEERQRKVREIERGFTELQELISNTKNDMIMFSPQEKGKAERSLRETEGEIVRMRDNFNNSLNRESLLAGSSRGPNLEGGSSSQRQQLRNQRGIIQQTNNTLDDSVQVGNATKEIGYGILGDLNRQKAKEEEIDSKLYDLNTDIATGERTTDRMLCRQKRQTALIWIAVVVVIIVFLSVFLYFVFRP